MTTSTTSAQSKNFAFKNGEWWYVGADGHTARARIGKCETCGRQFADYPGRDAKFCSAKCRRVECARCGKAFQPTSNRSKFCSLECKLGMAFCEECGKEFRKKKHTAARFCSRKCFGDGMAPIGSVRPFGSMGYTIIKVPEGTSGSKAHYGPNKRRWMLQHRYVMQQMIGRALVEGEQIHHKNGIRNDNRPENLELCDHVHPRGIRVRDKLKHMTDAELEAELMRRRK